MNKVESAAAKAPRGRRPGRSDTRERILQAARRRFVDDGYGAVSMRSIAADAGVDVALVSYHFGSKQAVFGAAMALTANPAEVIAAALPGDLDGLPERILVALLHTWDDPALGGPLRALAAAAGQEPALATVLRELLEHELIEPVADRLSGTHRIERAGAFAAQLAGLIFTRHVIALPPLDRLPAEELVRRLVPALRATLAGLDGEAEAANAPVAG